MDDLRCEQCLSERKPAKICGECKQLLGQNPWREKGMTRCCGASSEDVVYCEGCEVVNPNTVRNCRGEVSSGWLDGNKNGWFKVRTMRGERLLMKLSHWRVSEESGVDVKEVDGKLILGSTKKVAMYLSALVPSDVRSRDSHVTKRWLDAKQRGAVFSLRVDDIDVIVPVEKAVDVMAEML
jgi:hypothetical protein